MDEIARNGNVAVRYRVARLRSPIDVILKCDNPNEILQQGFYPIELARVSLHEQRQKMLDKAVFVARQTFSDAIMEEK